MKTQISILHISPGQEAKKIVQQTISESTLPIKYVDSFESDSIMKLSLEPDSKPLVIIHENAPERSFKSILNEIITTNPDTSVIRTFDDAPPHKELNGVLSEVKNLSSIALADLPEVLKKTLDELAFGGTKKDFAGGLFRTIVEKDLNEIFIMNPKTQGFIYANQPFLNSFGYNSEDLLAHHFEDIIAADKRIFSKQMIASLLESKTDNITFQVDCVRADGSLYPAQINLENIREQGKDLILGFCIDLSSQKQNIDLLEAEQQTTKKLKLSNRYKSTFFANLSHEMRTTLNSTLILSAILNENRLGNLKKEQLKYISTIHNSNSSLLSLLNEVLDHSKIESGKISMRPEYVDIAEFCKELERLFKPVASEKGIRFEYVNDLDNELALTTDSLRLEQVIKNLISNALKFTDQGFVKLRVFQPDPVSLHKNGLNSKISFEISDTGIGIPKEQQEDIFNSYIQGEAGNTQNVIGGTGLGLSISKEITELLGGNIRLQSKTGEGSTFTVELPQDSSASILKNAEAGKIKLTTVPAKGDRIKPVKKKSPDGKIKGTVLLIDDSETHNMALSEFLSFKIKKTISVETAKSAFEVLESNKIDCIILDMFLPDASGKEVLTQLKNDDKFSSIPVIIYSGKSISQNEEDELGAFADAIIQKNVMSYKVLLSKLTGVLQKVNQPIK